MNVKNLRLLTPARVASLSLVAASVFAGSASAQVNLYPKTGDKANDRLGVSVRSCGDVNMDGKLDFIAGAPENGNFLGGDEGFARVYSGANGATLYTFNGVAIGDAFGSSVDGAGDVNADGYADLVIGAPSANSSAGRVYVQSGLTGLNLYTLNGGASGDGLGTTVAGLGDINADGYADFLGASPTAPGGGTSRGTARVYSGKTGVILATINGAANGDRIGVSADGVGDLNMDGSADFVIGSFFAGAKVYSGALVGSAGTLLIIPATTANDRYGIAVAGAGDVNNDGTPDILVGAPQDGDIFSPGPGFVRILSGVGGSIIRTLTGGSAGDRFGIAVAGARDMDGDLKAETLVGADQSVTGAPGYARLFKGSDGSVLNTFDGLANNSRCGVSVDGLGDIDGNGSFELIVGAPERSVPLVFIGRLDVWSVTLAGGCATPFSYCAATNNSAGTPALIGNTGTTSITANNFALVTTGCPPLALGLYYYGQTQIQNAFGNGFQCVGGATFRLQVISTTAGGVATFPVNFPSLGGPGQILSGSTWKFQFWHRDPPAGGAMFNLSDGLSATFCN